jgi:aryl-alcohol dehydrogenase-like predicted oxidoreductase
MSFVSTVTLGRTGLRVGRIGLGASYGVPAQAIERAYHERGVNYFYWGSIRRRGMRDAVRHLARAERAKIVVALQSYDRTGFLLGPFVTKGLRALGIERADLLILGWHDRPVSRRVLDAALRVRERGWVAHLAISGHDRGLMGRLAADPSQPFDALMFRYNAVHRGAETEILPRLAPAGRPGTIAYTATCWGQLLDPKRMPPGEPPLDAADCYRFPLSDPRVDMVLAGPANASQLDGALAALDRGELGTDELARVRRLGDHIHAGG